MRPDQTKILLDNRISSEARILLLWISVQPTEEGWVPMPFDVARGLLHGYPSDDAIRRHIRMLTGSGWLDRKSGGRGHPDTFRILDPLQSVVYPENRPALEPSLKDRPAPQPSLSPDRVALQPSLSAPVVGDREIVGEEGEETRARATPRESYPPDPRSLDVLAERADSLNGCRGALRDYLGARVPTDRQYGFIQTLATWLDGADPSVFRLPSGDRLPAGEIPPLLAAALNELLATDEGLMKRPIGDPGNLKTKLSILTQQRGRRDRHSDRTTPADQAFNPISGDRATRRSGAPAT